MPIPTTRSGAALDRAQISARNPDGKEIGSATTDANGRFYLALKALGKPFNLTVRRLGIVQTTSDDMTLQPSDTVDVELLVEEVTTGPLDTIKVKAAILANERNLIEAERRGWKVFSPKDVALRRNSARSLTELMQSLAVSGILMPRSEGECFRSVRNNRCLTIVVDGQPAGTYFYMPPSDIYFLAIVSANDAVVRWGVNRAPNGAIAVYTRMYGDRIR